LGLSKQRPDISKLLEGHLVESTANHWVCTVHLIAEVEIWNVVKFENSITVKEALQRLTKMLSSMLETENNWEDYVLTTPLPSNVQQVIPLGPLDKPLKQCVPPSTQVRYLSVETC
jgi:hypothetical protein